ncbi:protein-glucosylgalactosylhydroxylysine glucosidase-like [Ylistrum balloti]|uniref:protein-glucosylgalactosylhydroxylysine glucosidase-like n=1 Tax=Ylistrum balloti TaxID=509963 RepID=UPI002905E658|nr:protein-glucosylgalactosylhydroxylysine glucosidase-like [Ylistrum balloti]
MPGSFEATVSSSVCALFISERQNLVNNDLESYKMMEGSLRRQVRCLLLCVLCSIHQYLAVDIRMTVKEVNESTNVTFSIHTNKQQRDLNPQGNGHLVNTTQGNGHFVNTTQGNGHPVNTNNNEKYVTMIHGNTQKRIKYTERPYPAFLNPEVTVFSTGELPDALSMPTIGNGHVATVVHSDTMYLGGLYNGYNITSHRARLQSTSSISITGFSFDVNTRNHSLDVGRGIYVEEYTSDFVTVKLKMYAHQVLYSLLVTEISVSNALTGNVHLNLSTNPGPPSDDIEITNSTVLGDFKIYFGTTKEPEYHEKDKIPFMALSTLVPDVMSVPAGESVRRLFLTSVDFSSYVVQEYLQLGLDFFLNGMLESTHTQVWEESNWKKGRIDVGGNNNLSRINYAAMYYLLSEIPYRDKIEPFFGISPGGLAHGALNKDYEGHVFWDQETWMFPPMLLLFGDKGKKIIQTRVRTHGAAKQYAKDRGYQGAMYPWESAFTGLNVCPSTECSKYEQHITGDIAFAFKQYIMMTRDTNFIQKDGGADVITDIASFWLSRMTYNQSMDRFEIHDVMPPDEYHYPVNNSVYTNSVANISLLLPKYALSLVNRTVDPKFEQAAKKLYIPFNQTTKWHPEYDGYTPDTTVKQADVVLLGFPLMKEMSADVRENDLNIYEKVTPGGPAMTWGMFAIGWLEQNATSKAETLFKKQFDNVIPPFYIWSEEPAGRGARNFLTGMGGYLQSLMFGYGGFRIFEDRLQFNPTLPPDTSTFNITGVDYLGGYFDFSFGDKYMTVNQTKAALEEMKIVIASTGQTQTLDIGVIVQYQTCQAALMLV